MFRLLLLWVAFASAGASRISTEDASKSNFGLSCNDLQNRFHDQVHAIRTAFDAQTPESAFSQARLATRMLGMVRTLRRARECSWVIENNSDDIEEMRGIVQELVAGNPCGEVARSELEVGAFAETSESELRVIWRTMSILMSDDCEASEDDGDAREGDVMEDLQEAEGQLQDGIDAVMDAEEEGEGALIQVHQARQSGRSSRFLRGVGVFILMLFLLLACVSAATIIVFILVCQIQLFFGAWGSGNYAIITPAINAGLVTSAVGLVGCAHQLYTNLLPRLEP